MDSKVPQHKRMAMGQKQNFKKGGAVLKSGFPNSPAENVKRKNGVVGMCEGGKAPKRG